MFVNSSFDNLRLPINLYGRLIRYKHKIHLVHNYQFNCLMGLHCLCCNSPFYKITFPLAMEKLTMCYFYVTVVFPQSWLITASVSQLVSRNDTNSCFELVTYSSFSHRLMWEFLFESLVCCCFFFLLMYCWFL